VNNKLILVLLAIAIAVAAGLGCTHVREVAISPNTDPDRLVINRNAAWRVTTVTLNDGTAIKTHWLRVAPDSVRWMGLYSTESQGAPTGTVTQVSYEDNFWGAVDGLQIGLVTGLVFGALLGLSAGDDPPGWFSLNRDQKAVFLGLTLSALGGVAGAVTGAVVGSRCTYRLRSSGTEKGEVTPR
jgi:hypothetical protein